MSSPEVRVNKIVGIIQLGHGAVQVVNKASLHFLILIRESTGARVGMVGLQVLPMSTDVEGHNGYLAQLQHNQRSVPKQRYKVWTVLHSFDCRVSDGITPVSQFFRRSFPDPCETTGSKIDDLPQPRK
jgi:hypothetical protein